MTLEAAVQVLVGDYAEYADMSDRIEVLVARQVDAFVPHRSNWLVLPWRPPEGPPGFYLFSEDREGQRRGREVVNGFLGPHVAMLVSAPSGTLMSQFSPAWIETGLTFASFVQRAPQVERLDMLARLEDLVATVAGRSTAIEEIHPTHVDLLRDVRLAMLSKDGVGAQRLFDQLVLTGQLSAENIRFLTIEMYACFGRWQEMAELPYIAVLTQARRPRVVTESMLQMVWATQVAPHFGLESVASTFASQDVLGRYGSILRSIEVPSTPQGRILAYVTALADEDTERQNAIAQAVTDPNEKAALAALTGTSPAVPLAPELDPEPSLEREPEAEPEPNKETQLESEIAPIRAAFDSAQYKRVVELFLAGVSPGDADFAVQAVLDLEGHERAADVLEVVKGWVDGGALEPGRRLANDIDALVDLVANVTAGWVAWAQRIGAAQAWGDAAATLRNQHADWQPLSELTAGQVSVVADGVLDAIGSTNEQQLRACLDILCGVAADVVEHPSCAPFTETVLQFLADQENLSPQVREAYLTLFEAILGAGPTTASYAEVLKLTSDLWARIKARQHVDWALEIIDACAGASSPDPQVRDNFGSSIILYLRSLDRLSRMQRVVIESLAPDFAIPAVPLPAVLTDEEIMSVWPLLDGSVVGLYSLLPHAVPRFTARLQALCSPSEIVGNTDTTATSSLTNLAERAQHLIVDTWHAAHQATNAIDQVRPRSQQILPPQKGVTGFLRALESSLEN